MIIKNDGTFEINSLYPNVNWYTEESNFIIDETTDNGKLMQPYIDNFPFVKFEHDGKFVTKVIPLNKLEKPLEMIGKQIQLIKNAQNQWEYVYVDKPLVENLELEEIYTKLSQLEQENIELKNIVNTYFGGV